MDVDLNWDFDRPLIESLPRVLRALTLSTTPDSDGDPNDSEYRPTESQRPSRETSQQPKQPAKRHGGTTPRAKEERAPLVPDVDPRGMVAHWVHGHSLDNPDLFPRNAQTKDRTQLEPRMDRKAKDCGPSSTKKAVAKSTYTASPGISSSQSRVTGQKGLTKEPATRTRLLPPPDRFMPGKRAHDETSPEQKAKRRSLLKASGSSGHPLSSGLQSPVPSNEPGQAKPHILRNLAEVPIAELMATTDREELGAYLDEMERILDARKGSKKD